MPTLPIELGSDERSGMLMMMRGMTAKDFDPVRYSGRWFEVASLKRGFAGQGQEDCHCTQVNDRGRNCVDCNVDIVIILCVTASPADRGPNIFLHIMLYS